MQDLSRGKGQGLNWTRTIKFSGGRVVKEFEMSSAQMRQKQRRMEEVISTLMTGFEGVQTILSHRKLEAKRHRCEKFYLETIIGQSIPRVENTEQLRSLVVFLLRTIRKLHDKGITHRDIRLPNIVKYATDGKFKLIDWDDSVKGIQNLENAEVAHLDERSHAPEMFVEGGWHDSSVDLWSIGRLIEEFDEHADKELRDLKKGLLLPPGERLSDSEACNELNLC